MPSVVSHAYISNRDHSNKISTNVERSVPVNRYFYDIRTLWLAYGLAVFAALGAVLIGGVALAANGSSHNNAVSTLISICRHESLAPIFPPCCHGKLPLPDETMKTKVQLIKSKAGGQENLEVHPRGMAVPVCKLCRARLESGTSPASGLRLSSFKGWMSSPRQRSQSQAQTPSQPSPAVSPLARAMAPNSLGILVGRETEIKMVPIQRAS